MDTTLLTMNWSDEEWDKYNRATVTIPLSLLDSLLSAAQLASKGSRINGIANRMAWGRTATTTEAIVLAAIREIKAE